MIYFDNAATTRAKTTVEEKMSTMLCEQYGNPASVSAMGLAAEKEIRNAAEIIARGIHCKYDEIFFTSGGTEGDNWAIYGTAEGYKRQGAHFITTEIEHPAVKNPMKLLEENPDSSYSILESITTPQKMSQRDYALYCLLLTQSIEKTYRPLLSDSLIKTSLNIINYESIRISRTRRTICGHG